MFTQIGAILATALIIILFIIMMSGKINFARLMLVITAWVLVIVVFDLVQYLPNLLTILDIAMDGKVGK